MKLFDRGVPVRRAKRGKPLRENAVLFERRFRASANLAIGGGFRYGVGNGNDGGRIFETTLSFPLSNLVRRCLPIGEIEGFSDRPESSHFPTIPGCSIGTESGSVTVSRHGAGRRRGREFPELLFHDLRRSAIRNMERAGIARKIAIVYLRYDIVSQKDLAIASKKLEAFHI